MSAKVILGPWPGSNVVPLTDVRLEFARRVEQRMYEMEMQDVAKWLKVVDFMRGSSCTDATPSDSPGGEAA